MHSVLVEIQKTTSAIKRNDLAIRILDEKIEGGAEILITLCRDPKLKNHKGTLLWVLDEMDVDVPFDLLADIMGDPEASFESKWMCHDLISKTIGVGVEHSKFKMFGMVETTEDIETGDGLLPAGSSGTIVEIYKGGEAYEVEFAAPWHCVTIYPPSLIKEI